MMVLGMTPFHLVGFLVAGATMLLAGAGLWGLLWLKQREEGKHLPPDGTRRRRGIATSDDPAWRAGEDLLSYPDRLAQLEARLVDSHAAAAEQAEHLRSRGERVAAKDDRSELVERYTADAAALATRSESMRRVMALVGAAAARAGACRHHGEGAAASRGTACWGSPTRRPACGRRDL